MGYDVNIQRLELNAVIDLQGDAKAIAKWVKDIGELEFKGGIVEGKTLSAEDVDALSKSPSREELIGRIALLALSPGARLVSALLGPGGKLCGQVKSVAEKEGEQ